MGRLRTELNFEISADEISYEPVENGFRTDLLVRVKVFDLNMDEVVFGQDSIDIVLPELPGPEKHWLLPAQYILTLTPGYYRFGLEISDLGNGRHTSLVMSRLLTPMGEKLSVSDIQLASTIYPSWDKATFLKGNYRIVPHPLHAYRRPDPVRFYFEIYGLNVGLDDISYVDIQYHIEPKDEREGGPSSKEIAADLSSTIGWSDFGASQQAYLAVDSRDLPEGSYRLRVRVKDGRTRRSVETITSFSILE
jgi:hypothetical protein